MPFPKVAVFFTGGTIGMRHSADGSVRPALRLADLLADVSGEALVPPGTDGQRTAVSAGDLLLPVEWADLPSPSMTPDLMFRLAGDVRAMLARPDIAGAVVTHGTDVMEETAFMLDLLLETPKPVVVTGSMRSYDEAGYDGLRNLVSAARACLLPLPPASGVVLLMTDKLFAAREATKVHSMGVDAFDAPGAGPLGTCVAGGIQLFRLPVAHRPLPARHIESRVELVSLAPGMDGKFLACAREAGARGIVVEGFGAGNVPPGVLPEIERAVAAGIPVVLTSRCIEGGVWPVYGYSGGANQLRELGVLLGGNLRGQKARILLMVAIGCAGSGESPLEAARRVFEHFPIANHSAFTA